MVFPCMALISLLQALLKHSLYPESVSPKMSVDRDPGKDSNIKEVCFIQLDRNMRKAKTVCSAGCEECQKCEEKAVWKKGPVASYVCLNGYSKLHGRLS